MTKSVDIDCSDDSFSSARDILRALGYKHVSVTTVGCVDTETWKTEAGEEFILTCNN